MFGFMKAPKGKVAKENSVDPNSNPFDSDTEQTLKPVKRTASEPVLIIPNSKTKSFDDGNDRRGASSASSSYKNDFRDSGGLENQSVQELENYAVYKSGETTKSVNNCLKVAENIREDATKTLDMLHQQGDQITRTHEMAVDMDKDLSKGEKLLGNLGGMFSMSWKPKKTKSINGPVITADKPSKKSENHKEQREKLGLAPAPKGQSAPRTRPSEPTNALQKVEVEKAKQDDALSDLGDILGDLKNMAVDMGTELNKQNNALDHLRDDVDELNSRVKGANQRARHLLGK